MKERMKNEITCTLKTTPYFWKDGKHLHSRSYYSYIHHPLYCKSPLLSLNSQRATVVASIGHIPLRHFIKQLYSTLKNNEFLHTCSLEDLKKIARKKKPITKQINNGSNNGGSQLLRGTTGHYQNIKARPWQE